MERYLNVLLWNDFTNRGVSKSGELLVSSLRDSVIRRDFSGLREQEIFSGLCYMVKILRL